MTSAPRNDRQDTAQPGLTGRSNSSPSAGEPSHPPPEPPPPKKRYRTVLYLLLIPVVLLAGWFIWQEFQPRHSGYMTETTAVQNLKALASAQAKFIKKKESYCYATSGKELNTNGTWIAADLSNAFENWQHNGDSATPAPKAGYIYRMLQGDKNSPTAYYNVPNDPASGMSTWAATCRPIDSRFGVHQFYITEAGWVYKMTDPPKGDPRYGQFLLDCTPAQSQTTWTTAK